MAAFTVLFFGDIVGRPGRNLLKEQASVLRNKFCPDLVVANGENASGGLGIEAKTASEIFDAGVDLITTGNHIWSKKEAYPYLEQNSARIIRPLNYPQDCPGKGWTIWTSSSGVKVSLINVLGRVFIDDLVDCPFRALDKVLDAKPQDVKICLVDFHAEATSEKLALAYYLDGRVSAVLGTHTHVQTSDERILTGGTGYITDVGMCGPYNSILGVRPELIVKRFLTAMPQKFELANGARILNGVILKLDVETGKTLEISRINSVFSV